MIHAILLLALAGWNESPLPTSPDKPIGTIYRNYETGVLGTGSCDEAEVAIQEVANLLGLRDLRM